MNFGFDIDGVLYPWHVEVWKWYIDKTGENMSMTEFWKYPDGHVAKNEDQSWIIEMVNNPVPYVSQPINIEVLNSVRHIADHYANNIYYITSRPTKVKDVTRQWFEASRLPFAENLIFADEYELDGVKGKEATVLGTKCSYYVEDRPKYLETLPLFSTVFIMNTPYNQWREFNGCYRIDDLNEIPAHLDRFGVKKQ